MANETTSSTVEELVLTEAVDMLIQAYQYDGVTAVGYFRFKSLVGVPSAAASFPRAVKDATTDLATETTSLTPVVFETTATNISVSRVGIARRITETAIEDNILGRALWTRELIMDAAILLGEALDEDAIAEFANASNSVTDTGNAIEILDLVEAMGTQRAAKAKGPQVVHLHDVTLKQLQRAQASATTTPWATFFSPNADGNSQYGGLFMNSPVWSSSLNPTANSAADRVGCVWAQGQAAPKFCAFAYVSKRLPTTKFDAEILADCEIAATFTRYGVGTPCANFATRLEFDA